MQSVVPEYHARMMKLLRESPSYEAVSCLYREQLQQKIQAINVIHRNLLYELDERYIEILENTPDGPVFVEGISSDEHFKKIRRKVYQYFESTIAKLEFQIHQATQFVESRKKQESTSS